MTLILQMRKASLSDGELVIETWLESAHPSPWILDDISPILDIEARLHAIISSWSCPQTQPAYLASTAGEHLQSCQGSKGGR